MQELADSDENIVTTGYLFGDEYRQISAHCQYFVLPAGIDGTRPVLLDQMAFGNCVVVRDTAANMEVIADAGLSFSDDDDVTSLASVISRLENNEKEVLGMRDKAMERVMKVYSWEQVTDQYESLFQEINK